MKEFVASATIVLALAASVALPQQEKEEAATPKLDSLLASRPVVNQALTLQEAVEIALKESPVVRGAEEEVNMAVAQVSVAKVVPRPILSTTSLLTTGSAGNLLSTPAQVMPQSLFAVPRSGFLQQNLTLMYPLHTGGRLKALIRQAEAARQASDAELEAVKRDLALEVKTAYRQVLMAQATADIFKSLVATTEERLRISRLALEEGRAYKAVVLRDEAEEANARQMLINANRDVELAFVMLKTAMGLGQASRITLSDKLTHEPVQVVSAERQATGEAAERSAVERFLALAGKQRPELKAARQRIEAAQQGVTIAQSAYKPQLSLMAMADSMRGREMDSFTGSTFGVVAGLPILDGGMRRSQVEEARANQRRWQREYEKVALQVAKEVESAFLALQAAEQSIKTAGTALASAEEGYRVAQLRYESGRSVNVEVLDALAAFTRARANQVQALYDYNVARDQLIRAVGQQ